MIPTKLFCIITNYGYSLLIGIKIAGSFANANSVTILLHIIFILCGLAIHGNNGVFPCLKMVVPARPLNDQKLVTANNSAVHFVEPAINSIGADYAVKWCQPGRVHRRSNR